MFREEREKVIAKLIEERKRDEDDDSKFGMAKNRRPQGFVDYNQQDPEDWHEHYKLPTAYKER